MSLGDTNTDRQNVKGLANDILLECFRMPRIQSPSHVMVVKFVASLVAQRVYGTGPYPLIRHEPLSSLKMKETLVLPLLPLKWGYFWGFEGRGLFNGKFPRNWFQHGPRGSQGWRERWGIVCVCLSQASLPTNPPQSSIQPTSSAGTNNSHKKPL